MEFIIHQLEDTPLKYEIKEKKVRNESLSMIDITMPDHISHLLYMPLPSFFNRKDYSMGREQGIYHHIKPSVSYAIQPRKTLCYSYVYNYSKTNHPVEETLPSHIKTLYQVTNELFNLENGVNMDLVNYYPTGRHYISAHSDDVRQFGRLKDVYCWIFGPATRLALFRSKEDKKEVLRLSIPEGLYVMQGLEFQKHYTHEFPELHSSLFKRLCAGLKETEGFPLHVEKSDYGASKEGIVRAEWIKDNVEFVRYFIAEGNISKGKRIEKDMNNFEEWILDRTSHTLRQFIKKIK